MTLSTERRGVTLLELMVSLVILSIAATIVGLSVSALDDGRSSANEADAIVAARRRAINTGHSVVVQVRVPRAADSTRWDPGSAMALPDGSVLAPRELGIDRLTGARDVRRTRGTP